MCCLVVHDNQQHPRTGTGQTAACEPLDGCIVPTGLYGGSLLLSPLQLSSTTLAEPTSPNARGSTGSFIGVSST